MSESEDKLVPRAESDIPREAQRPEESPEWVVDMYRKHMLAQVKEELDRELGPGRGPETLIEPVLLDINPVHHRESLQEQVFPVHREVTENLLDVPKTKILLEAGSGMGKTLFLKLYQERMLQAAIPEEYPAPVYFDLSELPDGTGFSEFYPRFYEHMAEVVKREEGEDEDLEINPELLGRTLERLVWTGQILFLVDGLEQMQPEDRFRFYMDVVVDGDALKDNFLLLTTRPVGFGPLATTSVVRRGEDSGFRATLQPLSENQRKLYLPEKSWKKDISHLALFYPETLETPYLLKMVKSVVTDEDCDAVTRTAIYSQWIRNNLRARFGGKGESWIDAVFAQLEHASYRLVKDGVLQRYEKVETGFDMKLLEDCAPAKNVIVEKGELLPDFDWLLRQNQGRWEFRHPSLQEFFAGKKLAELPDWKDFVRERCRDDHWFGVHQFFAGSLTKEVDDFFLILLEEGAVFLAGNVMPEVEGLDKGLELLVGQLLKYQCKEAFPQFAISRLVRVADVLEKNKKALLDRLIPIWLGREKRESRVLFGVFELVLARHEIKILDVVDSQDFEAVFLLEEFQEFFAEHKDPKTVDMEIMRKWGEMISVSAGKFIYQDERDEEDRVMMKEYTIMKYPVSNGLYRQFDPHFSLRYPKFSSQDDQPVIGINYFEATIFGLWMNLRVPTEKEWEKAARGLDGRDYPWGEAMGYQEGFCNTCDFVIGKTTPVTGFEDGVSPYGCYDMAGNVWEWCVQLYSSKFTTQKIVRGGSWLTYMVQAKCTFRNSFDPSDNYPAVGLRLMSLPLSEIEMDDDEDG